QAAAGAEPTRADHHHPRRRARINDRPRSGGGGADARVLSGYLVRQWVRKQLVEEGFEAVLTRKPRAMPAVARIIDGEKEDKPTGWACSKPPKGRPRWTWRLLQNKGVELGIVARPAHSPIGAPHKKTLFSPIAASPGSSRRRPTARS